ncbi:MAG: glucose-1-phosphate thymidylyltransferase RfbA [Rickettsiaceae bacterium]|nr:glucose-1-phosphate thymidylyltransferase RfbA [Rickettsiaceae bacterium]
MKGIILAGGHGTRLYPLTKTLGKQLLPVYDKPMIYYPLATIMEAGIREIAIISTKEDLPLMQDLLDDGASLGISLTYITQERPDGIAQSFLLAENFIGQNTVCLILGDNIFYGPSFTEQIRNVSSIKDGAAIFGYHVSDPERYGVVAFDKNGKIEQIIEKPKNFVSSYAVPGLYFYDNSVIAKAKTISPSSRGELEITDIHNLYIKENNLSLYIIDKGVAWMDAGTFDSLIDASLYVQVLEKRQGIKVGCPEAVALSNKWISREKILDNISKLKSSPYIEYLRSLGQIEK